MSIPGACEPMAAVTEDGWTEWIHPVEPYFMQCCDCGLIHKAEFGITKDKEAGPNETWNATRVSDGSMEVIFRMRRARASEPGAEDRAAAPDANGARVAAGDSADPPVGLDGGAVMGETPRTDAKVGYVDGMALRPSYGGMEVVPSSLARELERELSWQRERIRWKDLAQTLTGVDANDHGWLRAEIESQWRRNAAYAGLSREALESIAQYGSDTLSGRADGPDDRDWQREAVKEMTRRARAALKDAPIWKPAPGINPANVIPDEPLTVPCGMCYGSGKRSNYKANCLVCKGTGRATPSSGTSTEQEKT